jgi:predicted regulator of Ras-like GTPase activity (Roadblock/LC7/MglB family)
LPFKTIIRALVESTPGASGAILTDWEGEAVEQYSLADEFELKLIGAHKGIILNRMKDIQQKLLSGDVLDTVVSTDTYHVIIGAIDQDYSLIMTLGKDSLVAKALREFRCAVKSLKKEIC